jgi:hypothetical protein
MGNADDGPIRKGDRGFLFRLLGGVGVVIVLAIVVLGLLDQSRLGNCAARGFLEVTDTPSSD